VSLTVVLKNDSFVEDLTEKPQPQLFRMRKSCFLSSLLRSSVTRSLTTSVGSSRGVPL